VSPRAENLRVEQDGPLRRIALAAPERRNVLDAALAEHFLRELAEAEEDPATGAILLEADGPMFCGGLDPASPPSPDLFSIGRQGCTFGLIDIREGRWNEGVLQAVAEAIGQRRALELALTGRIFSTAEAAAWGLVHIVAPAFELEDRATQIATALANANRDVVRAALSNSQSA
jgi:enoyl-CoA hydratase/carnithine racemase